MTNFFKLSLYLTSFIPLWIAIIIKNMQSMFNNTALNKAEIISTIVLLVVSALSLLDLQIEIGKLKSYSKLRVVETAKKDKAKISEITLGFALTYCLPLIVFNFTTFTGCAQFAIAFFILSYICLKNNILFPNITLLLFGYTPYKATFVGCKTSYLIFSRNRSLDAQAGEEILVYQLNNDAFLSF